MIRTSLIGIKGDPGPAGPAGAAGPSGAQGKSAYQIAVEQGFTGTELQWTKNLQGGVAHHNRLINSYPVLRCRPYRADDVTGFTAKSEVGGTIVLDTGRTDPFTGGGMAKITIPAGNTSYQTVDYFDLPAWQMEPNDVWMFLIYVPVRVADISIQILVSDGAAVSGTDYRQAGWTVNDRVSKGYNLLTMLHVENAISSVEYGTVGTTIGPEWVNSGTQTEANQSKSIRMRVKVVNPQASDTVVYFGSVLTADAGWSKGAVMWMADDVPNSWADLAIPVIESYGWKTTMAAVSVYSADPAGNYIYRTELEQLRSSGHEIWNHTRFHENMVSITNPEKDRAIKMSQDYWSSFGIPEPTKYITWPFGQHDDYAVNLVKSYGFKMGLATVGDTINPMIIGTNPFYINRFTIEKSNPWQVDSVINGAILKGCGMVTYGHTAITGGAGSPNAYPGAVSFYVDHLKRWCDLVAAHEDAGRCVVTTVSEYFKLCGINPDTHKFLE